MFVELPLVAQLIYGAFAVGLLFWVVAIFVAAGFEVSERKQRRIVGAIAPEEDAGNSIFKPQPGPYGPVPWSSERPWPLWAFAAVVAALNVVPVFAARDLTIPWVGFAVCAVFVWLMLRGSRVFWWMAVILSIVGLCGMIPAYIGNRSAPGRMWPSPTVQLIQIILIAAGLALLLWPSCRAWFNLETRAGSPTPD